MSSTDKPFSWSYSRLRNYETCPRRSYHYDILKDIVEEESDQLKAGNDLHKAFDSRISKGTGLPLGLMHHEPLLEAIVKAPGDTHSEQKLALTSSFAPVGYFGRNVWFRTVIDAAKVQGTGATVFDWKTGKPSNDLTQLSLMAVTLFHHMPKLERVKAALLFVNHGTSEKATYTRADVTPIWSEILPRVKRLEKAREEDDYPPRPSGLCKKYCNVQTCEYHGRGA